MTLAPLPLPDGIASRVVPGVNGPDRHLLWAGEGPLTTTDRR